MWGWLGLWAHSRVHCCSTGLIGRPRRFLLEPVRVGGVRVEEVGWSHFLKQCTKFLIPLSS